MDRIYQAAFEVILDEVEIYLKNVNENSFNNLKARIEIIKAMVPRNDTKHATVKESEG